MKRSLLIVLPMVLVLGVLLALVASKKSTEQPE